jgi:hypothetical protein
MDVGSQEERWYGMDLNIFIGLAVALLWVVTVVMGLDLPQSR